MNLRSIPRAAIGGYIKVLRWPLDRTAALLRRDGEPSGAERTVDRADAAARGAAGTVLGDEELKREANRRSLATDERERAATLRKAAGAQVEAAEEQLEQRNAEAERRRQQAAERAERKRKQVEQDRAAKELSLIHI